MPTPIELLDTSIKIGLGALISGVATYWVTHLKQKGEAQQAQSNRRIALLVEVATQTENVNHVYLKYWALVIEGRRYNANNKDWSEDRQRELTATSNELFHSFKDLTSAEAKLLLLGEKEMAKLMHEFGCLIRDFRRKVYIDKKVLTEDKVDQWKKQIYETREKIFENLAKAYKRI